MKPTKYLLIIVLSFSFAIIMAKDYNASLFGTKSNGTTMNTTSIQKGIDYINENGGGRLVFYVGRYLTGTR
jgi:polygalacturonase